MWTIGQKTRDGYTVETGPLDTPAQAAAYAKALKPGILWAVRQAPDGKMKKIGLLMLIVAAGFLLVLLAGCGGGSGGGVRATAEALGTTFPTEATPQPVQSVTMVVATRIVKDVEQVRVEVPVVQPVEVTRIVEATVIVEQPVVQPVEVTRVVEVVITPTPAIQGFDTQPAIDESVQPCPVIYWRNGRCVATQQQLDDYAAQGGN